MCPAHIHAQSCMFQITWIKLSWSPKKHSHIAMQPSFKGASAQKWFSLLRWRTRGGPGLVRGQKITWRKILRDSVCPPKAVVQLLGGGSVSIFKTCYHCKVTGFEKYSLSREKETKPLFCLHHSSEKPSLQSFKVCLIPFSIWTLVTLGKFFN